MRIVASTPDGHRQLSAIEQNSQPLLTGLDQDRAAGGKSHLAPRPRWQVRIGVDLLLVTHSDLADDIEIRPVGLKNKEITHGDRWFKNDV